jgi:hypothetical protein
VAGRLKCNSDDGRSVPAPAAVASRLFIDGTCIAVGAAWSILLAIASRRPIPNYTVFKASQRQISSSPAPVECDLRPTEPARETDVVVEYGRPTGG